METLDCNPFKTHAKRIAYREAQRRAVGGVMRCYHCGDPFSQLKGKPEGMNDPKLMTADHYPIPRCRGGRTNVSNIVAACKECNERLREHNGGLGT